MDPTTPMGDISRYFDSAKHSDVTIKFSGHELKAHKIRLCCASDYFRGAFEGNFQVGTNQSAYAIITIERMLMKCRRPAATYSSSTTTTPTPSRVSLRGFTACTTMGAALSPHRLASRRQVIFAGPGKLCCNTMLSRQCTNP